MTVFGYVSGSARRHRVHVIVEKGAPTDVEAEELQSKGLQDYEVGYVVSACGLDSRKLGWKGYVVVGVNLEEPYVCAVCKRLIKKDRK